MSLQKVMVVLGIIFLVSLGLCGLSVSYASTNLGNAVTWISLVAMVLSGVLLILLSVAWFISAVIGIFRGRN